MGSTRSDSPGHRAWRSRLQSSVRAEDTVARFGGDEFAALVHCADGSTDARSAAERIIELVQRPIAIDQEHAGVTASVGIAVHSPGMTADDLLREADAAMYTAKTSGKSRFVEA
ncbi:GGDEF domain-containing protein [Dactylosporangium sp. NPDC006015]|uniref:GGDEF domain-containing protein n=1 Tax=Dactylosporangium sp. NPDC006015 TaxID=3154576 RepID=UPI0033B11E73